MNNLDTFYADSRLLKSMPWIFSVFVAVYVIFALTSYATTLQPALLTSSIIYIFIGILSFCTVNAYSKHDASLMKGLMGSLLAVLLIHYITQTINAWTLNSDITLVYNIIYSVMTVIFIIVFCNHFSSASRHDSSVKIIHTNEILILILIGLSIAELVISLSTFSAGSVGTSVAFVDFIVYIAEIAALNTIICIECKLNEYKIIREKSIKDGTWTEEKKQETKDKCFDL